jgi:ketosteroid isomerase-like protein
MLEDKTRTSSTRTVPESSNVQVAQTIYAAFTRGDVPGILACIDDDMRGFGVVGTSVKDVPWHLQIDRKADVPKFFQAIAAECDFTRFEPHDFAVGGDHVYCTVRYDMTLRRNGRKLSIDNSMHRFTFRNGRVVEWRGTEDTAMIREALLSKN